LRKFEVFEIIEIPASSIPFFPNGKLELEVLKDLRKLKPVVLHIFK
jgi:hypothetical protein